MESINSTINERVLPSIQNTKTSQSPGFREMDHRSSRLSRTAETKSTKNDWKNNTRPILVNSSQHDHLGENSDLSQLSDEDHDRQFFKSNFRSFLLIPPE